MKIEVSTVKKTVVITIGKGGATVTITRRHNILQTVHTYGIALTHTKTHSTQPDKVGGITRAAYPIDREEA